MRIKNLDNNKVSLNNIEFRDYTEFSNFLINISDEIGFKVSARGWAYILEQKRYINKDEFDKVSNLINKCRKEGYLPIDFVAEEDARSFKGIEEPFENTVVEDFGSWLHSSMRVAHNYIPDWWEDEEYYIQMLVEKVDLVTLFLPICKKYHIPIANSKGWSSMLQRAEYARRFSEARDKGLKCVLLYCGDHDPDGVRISDFIRKNLYDLKDIQWEDGTSGYNPKNLIIDRFGLNYEFIIENNFTWIDNLITGSGKNLASLGHKNHYMPYVQDYLDKVGERKCEANSIVVLPDVARNLAKEAIEKYLGNDAIDRFNKVKQKVHEDFEEFLNDTNTGLLIDEVFTNIKNWNK